MLLLKKHLIELVRAGKKRQTIRYWSRPIVFPGQVSFTPGLGKMKILRVEELAGYDALTLNDARDDGFENLEELLAELKRNYPEVPPGKRLYRVVFQWPLEMPVSVKDSPQRMVRENVTSKVNRTRTTSDSTAPRNESIISSAAKTNTKPNAKGGMSSPQRELLRQWVISRHPGKQ